MRRHGLAARLLSAFGFTLAAVTAVAEPRVIDVPLRAGTLGNEPRVIRVHQGDEVTLRWTTDRALTVHLHGYDLETAAAPAAPVTMRFTARATGRFPMEVHGAGLGTEVTVGYLEVHPR